MFLVNEIDKQNNNNKQNKQKQIEQIENNNKQNNKSGLCVVQVLGCFGKKKLKHSAELHSKILPQQQPQATKT